MKKANFLGQHPKVVKNVLRQTFQPKSQSVSISQQEMRNKLLADQQQNIAALKVKLQQLTTQAKLSSESLQYYDPSLQLDHFTSQVAAVRDQIAYLNQQISNCQQVEHQTTPQQYYLWKKKQRVDAFDMSMGELYMRIDNRKSELQSKIQENKSTVEQCHRQMEEMQEEIMQFQAYQEPSTIEIPQHQGDIEELTERNIHLHQQYNSILSTLEILNENKEILTAQLVDGVQSIEKVLGGYFQGEKIRLNKQLKQLKAEAEGKQVAPLTAEQQSYKVDPLIADYSHRLKEMQSSLLPSLKPVLQPILTPLPWQNFSFIDQLQLHSHQNVYDEYRQMEVRCMQVQVQLKKLQEEEGDIDSQIIVYQGKIGDLGSSMAKLNKIIK